MDCTMQEVYYHKFFSVRNFLTHKIVQRKKFIIINFFRVRNFLTHKIVQRKKFIIINFFRVRSYFIQK